MITNINRYIKSTDDVAKFLRETYNINLFKDRAIFMKESIAGQPQLVLSSTDKSLENTILVHQPTEKRFLILAEGELGNLALVGLLDSEDTYQLEHLSKTHVIKLTTAIRLLGYKLEPFLDCASSTNLLGITIRPLIKYWNNSKTLRSVYTYINATVIREEFQIHIGHNWTTIQFENIEFTHILGNYPTLKPKLIPTAVNIWHKNLASAYSNSKLLDKELMLIARGCPSSMFKKYGMNYIILSYNLYQNLGIDLFIEILQLAGLKGKSLDLIENKIKNNIK